MGKRVKQMKKSIKITLGTIGVIGLSGITWGGYELYVNPYRGTIKRESIEVSTPLEEVFTKEEAITELDYLMGKVAKHHPIAITEIPRELRVQYEKEVQAFEEEVTTLEIWQAASRILHLLGDAHTSMRYEPAQVEVLPIDRRTREKVGLEGYKIEKINNDTLAELEEKYRNMDAFEIQEWSKEKFEREIVKRHVLEFVGVDTSEEIEVTYKKEEDVVVKNYDIISWEKYVETIGYIEEKPFVYYDIDLEKGIGIFTLNTCKDDTEYEVAVRSFFEEVKDYGIKNVIVDLRENTGGTTDVITRFFTYLPVEEYQLWSLMKARFGSVLIPYGTKIHNNKEEELLFEGDLYVLTSSYTFSSAMDFATAIADNQLGQIVGEVPGNMPTCYGDNLYFQMPKTKLWFSVSYKYFERMNKDKLHEPLVPDDVVEGEAALLKVYEIIENKK